MNDSITARILNTLEGSAPDVGALIRQSGLASGTVIRYLRELEQAEILVRETGQRRRRGRPPVYFRMTPEGIGFYATLRRALVRRLARQYGAVWGPRTSFTFWGAPFVGGVDLFSPVPIPNPPFPTVRAGFRALYDDRISTPDGEFPRAEPLSAWSARSQDPRLIAIGRWLLGRPQIQIDRLQDAARALGVKNRVGFLAESLGRPLLPRSYRPEARRERLLAVPLPVDAETARLARKWNVANPPTLRFLKDTAASYGRAG